MRNCIFHLFILLFVTTIGMTLPGCSSAPGDSTAPADTIFIRSDGIVLYVGGSAPFYGIQDAAGNRYTPTNLAEEYHVDRMMIYFEGTLKADNSALYDFGRILEITKIVKL